MNYKNAKTEAITMANLTGANHVIVKIDSIYNVYSEKQYPIGYLELIEPVKIEEIVVRKTKKTASNDISEA